MNDVIYVDAEVPEEDVSACFLHIESSELSLTISTR